MAPNQPGRNGEQADTKRFGDPVSFRSFSPINAFRFPST